MGRLNDLQKGRNDGLAMALKIVQTAAENGEDPVKALEDEVKYRNANMISVPAMRKEIEKYQDECRDRALTTCYTVSSVIIAMTLRDELDFGRKRINRFLRRYLNKMFCMDKHDRACVSIEEYNNCLKEEVGIDLLHGGNETIELEDDKAAKYRRQQLYGG